MTGLRARQKLNRNNRILEAAAELFKRDGYEAVKMEAIAAASEVSIGTIYNYYQNKGDLLVAIVSMEVHEVLQAGAGVVAQPPKNAIDAVDTLVGIYYDHSLIYLSKEMWRVAMSISTQQPFSPFGLSYIELDAALKAQTHALILKLQTMRLVQPDCDAEAVGEVIFNNLNMMFIGFVKDETMKLLHLRRQVKRQNRAILSSIVVS
jgi:AcrR family transcriptional regulator